MAVLILGEVTDGALNLDGHGKSHSFRLLGMKVQVPARFL